MAMVRRFNVSGMCRPDDHYMLFPLLRLPIVRSLVDNKSYFVLHAPRQVGKSTTLLSVAHQLTAAGHYAAVLVSMETGAAFPKDPGAAELAILDDWRRDAHGQLPADLQPPPWPEAAAGSRIAEALEAWTRACRRPLVIFLDEIDALRDESLVSVLRQLRSGFRRRPEAFPWSLALCGMRDVRDYKVQIQESDHLRSASPFNIKDESLTLRNFTAEEMTQLLTQHTSETGQIFMPEALARIFELTQGQPWLVNALARQLVEVVVPDRSHSITAEHVEQAREILIERRDTHIDSLADKLHEPRVRRIIEPILTGDIPSMDVMNDDLMYVRDLGLIIDRPTMRIANPIYQEIIPRFLTYVMQSAITQEASWYKMPGGGLDMVLLLASFQEFFAEQSEAWLQRFDYHEAGPHLILMAFLQRVVNGGGRIRREFAVGSRRADLVVEFGGRRAVLELKLYRGPDTEAEGVAQLSRYLDGLGEAEGHLLIFDRRKGRSWADRIVIKEVGGSGGQRIYVFGM